MRASYAQLARRCDAAMATVHVTVDCPLCELPVAVRVDGASDVSITDACAERCHESAHYPWDRLQDDAVAKAQGERQEYLTHLMDGGE